MSSIPTHTRPILPTETEPIISEDEMAAVQAVKQLEYLQELDNRIDSAREMYPKEYEHYKKNETKKARRVIEAAGK